MEIQVNTNLTSLVKRDSEGVFFVKDGKIDVIVVENGLKLDILGKGKRGNCSIIRGYVEEFKKQEIELMQVKADIESLLENIISLSEDTVEFTNLTINRTNYTNNKPVLFVEINKYDPDYGFNRKIGFIEIDCKNFEIVNKSRRENELFTNFINSYNKYINHLNGVEIEEITPAQEPKELYTVGNIYFNLYSEAENYCIESDFLPELIIVNAGELSPLASKIKELDKEIDSLLDASQVLKKDINKRGLQYLKNSSDPTMIEYFKLNNEMEILESKIDILRNDIKIQDQKTCNNIQVEYKKAYAGNKYKIINNDTNNIFYTNDIKEYLYNFNYTIIILLDGQELYKQAKNSNIENYWWRRKNDYTVREYYKNDTINKPVKIEVFTKNKELISKEIKRYSNTSEVLSYVFIKDFRNNLHINNDYNSKKYISLFIDKKNKKTEEMELIQNLKYKYRNNKEVMELFDMLEPNAIKKVS